MQLFLNMQFLNGDTYCLVYLICTKMVLNSCFEESSMFFLSET